jgi:hypothetical protein
MSTRSGPATYRQDTVGRTRQRDVTDLRSPSLIVFVMAARWEEAR